MDELSTYPGTDLLVRLCYGCEKEVTELNDLWVDVDSNCCVCTACAEKGMRYYASEGEALMSIRPASTWDPRILNGMEEG